MTVVVDVEQTQSYIYLGIGTKLCTLNQRKDDSLLLQIGDVAERQAD